MTTKLTLTLEKEVIDQAKTYAAQEGRSLSDIVENYFKLLTHYNEQKTTSSSSRVSRLRGILKVDENFDYRQALEEALTTKYGG